MHYRPSSRSQRKIKTQFLGTEDKCLGPSREPETAVFWVPVRMVRRYSGERDVLPMAAP